MVVGATSKIHANGLFLDEIMVIGDEVGVTPLAIALCDCFTTIDGLFESSPHDIEFAWC